MLILTNETHGIVFNSLGMHKKGSPINRVKVKVLKKGIKKIQISNGILIKKSKLTEPKRNSTNKPRILNKGRLRVSLIKM